MKVGAVILAAGRSTRMGENKLVADLGGKPVIGHVVDAVLAAGLSDPVIVLGHDAPMVDAAIGDRAGHRVIASDYALGMSRSLAAGIGAVPEEWQAAILCLGDMPMIPSELLIQLAARAAPDAIIFPIWRGRRGHPVLWGRAYFAELMDLAGDQGARSVADQYTDRVTMIDWADDSVLIDADTPEALDHLRSGII